MSECMWTQDYICKASIYIERLCYAWLGKCSSLSFAQKVLLSSRRTLAYKFVECISEFERNRNSSAFVPLGVKYVYFSTSFREWDIFVLKSYYLSTPESTETHQFYDNLVPDISSEFYFPQESSIFSLRKCLWHSYGFWKLPHSLHWTLARILHFQSFREKYFQVTESSIYSIRTFSLWDKHMLVVDTVSLHTPAKLEYFFVQFLVPAYELFYISEYSFFGSWCIVSFEDTCKYCEDFLLSFVCYVRDNNICWRVFYSIYGYIQCVFRGFHMVSGEEIEICRRVSSVQKTQKNLLVRQVIRGDAKDVVSCRGRANT